MKTKSILVIALTATMMACNSEVPTTPDPEVVVCPIETPENPEQPEEKPKCKAYVPIEISNKEYQVCEKLNDFGWRLFRNALDDEDFSGNASISPLSVSLALSLALNGADGQTLDEMLSVMGLTVDDMEALNSWNHKQATLLAEADNTATFELANALWYDQDYPIYDSYTNLLQDVYEAEVNSCPLNQIVDNINAWCSEKTHGLINQIVERPSVYNLLNVMYFRGYWRREFDKADTYDDTFISLSGETSTVPFMHWSGDADAIQRDEYVAMPKSFGNTAFMMYFIQPREGYDIASCIDNICETGLNLTSCTDCIVNLSLPKFKFDNKLNLINIMRGMGMETPFTDEADFSKMTEREVLINQLLHAASIAVDEGGAEAAAVTEVGLVDSCLPDEIPTIDINLNHPFIYAIVLKQTGTPIMIGKVENL